MIRPFLAGQAFEPETVTMMSLAFERTCEALGLRTLSDEPATRLVAEKVIELPQRGVRDPKRLAKMTLEEFNQSR